MSFTEQYTVQWTMVESNYYLIFYTLNPPLISVGTFQLCNPTDFRQSLNSSFQILGNSSIKFSIILSLTLLQTIWVHRGYV
jgi:hypothetical protein